jgi:ATP-binding cassette subfamily D (ALD) protein 3
MLIQHIKSVYSKKFFMGVFDSMLVKYGAVMIGYTILGLPVFRMKNKSYGDKVKGDDASLIAKDYIRNSSLLINLAKVITIKFRKINFSFSFLILFYIIFLKAIGRIVVSYKDLQSLSGYTYLVNELHTVMNDVKNEKFNRTQVNQELLKEYVGGKVNMI